MVMAIRVLMIDDHPAEISSTTTYIQQAAPHINLSVTPSVLTAKDILSTRRFDVIILGDNLAASLEFAKVVQAAGHSTGYIIVIETGDYQAVTDAFNGGVLHHVTRGTRYWECFPALIELAAQHAQVQAAERSARLTLACLLDVISEGVIIRDPQSRLVAVNTRLNDLLDRDLTDRIGEPLNDLFDSPTKIGSEATDEVRSGAGLVLQRVSRPIYDNEHRLLGQLEVYREAADATTRSDAEPVTAEDIERMRDRLLSRVSHELKTPLTSIMGFAHMMSTRPDAPIEKRQKWGNFIRSKSELLTRLVDDMMDLSKLQTGRTQMQRQPVELVTVIEDAIEQMVLPAPNREFVLNVAELPPIPLDTEQFTQALLHLFTNSHNFSPPEAPIIVTVTDEGDSVGVSIQDQGSAVVPDEQAYVFEPFANEPGEGHVPGRGLGLSIARRIIEAHGGKLWVDQYSDDGNTFKLTLPKTDAAPM
jgi:signal transduction histidine kinase